MHVLFILFKYIKVTETLLTLFVLLNCTLCSLLQYKINMWRICQKNWQIMACFKVECIFNFREIDTRFWIKDKNIVMREVLGPFIWFRCSFTYPKSVFSNCILFNYLRIIACHSINIRERKQNIEKLKSAINLIQFLTSYVSCLCHCWIHNYLLWIPDSMVAMNNTIK